MTVEKVKSANDLSPHEVYIVKVGSFTIGTIEKHRDDPGMAYPWHASIGTGETRQLIGTFYDEDDIGPRDGRSQAVQAIADRNAILTSGKVPAGCDYDDVP